MQLTVKQIAEHIKGDIVGEPETKIKGIAGIKEAKRGDITFIANSKYYPLLKTTKASAIITSRENIETSHTLIKTDNPSFAFAKVVELLNPDYFRHPKGIHPTAFIGNNVKLGKNVSIGPYAVIEEESQIEAGTIIYGGCYVGYQVKIGKNCLIYPQVTIRERTEIGSRVIIHSGTVIGSDGFGFTKVRGAQKKIPQIGIVSIEDNVEIGANVTIDRARFDKTVIGKGTKIDNLVQIAHNVIVGENSIIVAQAGISGSTVVGKNVILAGQVGVVGHIYIGDGAVAAAQAGVTKSIPPGMKVSGYPAREHSQAKRVNACLQRLPQLYKQVKELEQKLEKIKKQLKEENGKAKDNH